MSVAVISLRCAARPLALSVALLLTAVAGLVLAAPAWAAEAQAPFGDKVSAALKNYNRASPMIGSAGVLGEGGVAEAKALGFAAILDLRTAEEGAAEEEATAKSVGIPYYNIAVATKSPTDDQVTAFAAIIEDAENLPILVHCESANRVGAMWALYRAGKGVPAEIAVEEGRTLGLKPSREVAVRERLGLPPLTQ